MTEMENIKELTLLDANIPYKVREAINTCIAFINGDSYRVDKVSLGLWNVDNTSDALKPLSTPQKNYIDGKVEAAQNSANTYTNSEMEKERQRATEAEADLSARITAQEGLGGALTAYDFGKADPSEAELTQYALSQIPSISNPLDIWNSTHVTNLFDNSVWQLTNTQNTNPAIFEWVNIGSSQVAQATNDMLGTVKGNEKIRVLADGSLDTDAESIGAAPATQTEIDSESLSIVHTAVHNLDKTYSAAGITSINIMFDDTVKHGYMTGVNFISGNTPPQLMFTNNSGFALKVILGGEEIADYQPLPNVVVSMIALCDGINLYCYIAEV